MKEPTLKVVQIDKKIQETERRLDCFLSWPETADNSKSRSRCIGSLLEALKFLREHKMSKKKEVRQATVRLRRTLSLKPKE